MELVTGIAAASGGRCVLLADGERLQTKVRADHSRSGQFYSRHESSRFKKGTFMKKSKPSEFALKGN